MVPPTSFSFCSSATIKWLCLTDYGYSFQSDSEEVTNERRNYNPVAATWIAALWVCARSQQGSSCPNSSRQHFTVAKGETEQQSLSSCQESNEPGLFVRLRLGLWSTALSYLPPYPLPSHRSETATFSAPMGNGEFGLPPPKNIFFSKSSFNSHIITNITRNVLLFINRNDQITGLFFVSLILCSIVLVYCGGLWHQRQE